MDDNEQGTEMARTKWFISLDWFQQHNRSISPLIRGYLCPKCFKQLSEKNKIRSPEATLSAIKNCCSHSKGFINDRLPISESIFRLFLVNGNEPLELEELGRQLNQLRGGDPYRTAPENLLHLLKNDSYYGLQEMQN